MLDHPSLPNSFEWFWDEDRLSLIQKNTKTTPLCVDFSAPSFNYRLKQATLRKELLAKAIGIKPTDSATVVDATAGLGQDGFLLAHLGFHLLLIEESPILFALLQNGLMRAKENPDTQDAAARISLIQANSIAYLPTLPHAPDVITLDPMFPKRQKSAAVKKEMQWLQQLLPEPQIEDINLLFITALACATKRVVVKRPTVAPPLSPPVPHFALNGKSARFDVYLK